MISQRNHDTRNWLRACRGQTDKAARDMLNGKRTLKERNGSENVSICARSSVRSSSDLQ